MPRHKYDLDGLTRFVNDIHNGRTPDPADQAMAADALWAAMKGIDLQGELGLKPRRGQRGKIIDPDRVSLAHPLYRSVWRMLDGELTYADVKREFREQVARNVSDRTIERYIRQLKPKVARTRDTLYALSADLEKQNHNEP